MLAAIAHALMMSLTMAWEILWALILGFWLSAVIQAVVSKEEMSRLLPDDSPKTIAIACGLGAASSSCSYAAVALARSMFRKGANFTAAMAFQFASTNLVLELGILLAVLMGWQFTLAEFTGGPIMIIILVLLFKVFLTPRLVEAARTQADKGIQGRMEGHAGMDMSIHEGTIWQRMISAKGRTAISHFFVMDWASLWLDIGVGLLIAGALAAWVPKHFWQAFFFAGHPLLAKLWGPLIGFPLSARSEMCRLQRCCGTAASASVASWRSSSPISSSCRFSIFIAGITRSRSAHFCLSSFTFRWLPPRCSSSFSSACFISFPNRKACR
jgi:uncharacterized membrane protein YraQ (UPF0718 family)